MDEYVSMHHRIRKSLRSRLKHVSISLEKPVTDVVNDAIEIYLETNLNRDNLSQSVPAKAALLRTALEEGIFYGSATTLSKRELVDIALYLGISAELRFSGDHLISDINRALQHQLDLTDDRPSKPRAFA